MNEELEWMIMNIETIKRCGRFIGRKELLKHMEGQRLTQRQIIEAKCFECMGGYADGPCDCNIPGCPLYPLMPYRDKELGIPMNRGLEGGTAVQSHQEVKSTTPPIQPSTSV